MSRILPPLPVWFDDAVKELGEDEVRRRLTAHAMRERDSRVVSLGAPLTDKDLVQRLDELMYQLKTASVSTPLQRALYKALALFVKEQGLDSDPHAFAALKEEGEG